MNSPLALLSNASATGQGVKLTFPGRYVFAVAGTFGGATVKPQMLGPDGATWLDLGTEASFTAAGTCLLHLPAGTYRGSIAGGTPSGIYATLAAVGA